MKPKPIKHGAVHPPTRADATRPESGNQKAVMESVRETVAARLRSARELAGLSQGQVASMMKMHRPTISEIEAGRRRVSAEELKEFAQRYHTSVGWLTGEEPEIADPSDQRIRLAARELSKLSKDDLQRVLRFLATMIAADSDDSSAR